MSAGALSAVRSPAFTAQDAARYRAAGWWCDSTLSDAVRRNAEQWPDRAAYIEFPDASLSWYQFDGAANALAQQLAGAGVARGDRVAVWLGDSAAVHLLLVAVERCGATVVGIGARAGTREVSAILRSASAQVLITDEQRHDAAVGVAEELLLPLLALGNRAGTPSLNTDATPAKLGVESQLGADDVFLINSTSGTTGLPKCVVHTQNRWYYFHQKAVDHGQLTSDDIFLPLIPMPFGFGLWTSHTTPIYLGATAAILPRFTAEAACEAIARHKVTVMCCVSTQLAMLMADRASQEFDLSSLRVVFTGGEALPYRPAAAFKDLTGAK